MAPLQLNKFKSILSIYILFFVTACGGGSSSSSPEIKAPTVTFSASPTSLYINETTTLSWSSTNSTSCSGSGGWSGTKAINGNENVIISISGDTSFSIACSGVGGSASSTATVRASAKDLNISIAKWKDNKPSAISFDWDDSTFHHCSDLVGIFNNFNFKTTFGIVTQELNTPVNLNGLEICYKAIAFDGHEIASHSASHAIRFNDLNVTQEEKIYELEKSSDYIQDVFRYKPTLFIHPGNSYDPSNIMYKDYYLFSRIHNDFNDEEDFIANISSSTNYPRFKYILSLSIQESNWIKIAGHGLDGNGYEPVNSQDLIKFLGDLEESNIWVDTHSSIALYQLIRNSVTASTANSEIIFNLSESEIDNKLQEFGIEFLPITVLIDSSEPIDIEGYLTCNDIPIGGEPLQFNYNIMLNMNIPYKEC